MLKRVLKIMFFLNPGLIKPKRVKFFTGSLSFPFIFFTIILLSSCTSDKKPTFGLIDRSFAYLPVQIPLLSGGLDSLDIKFKYYNDSSQLLKALSEGESFAGILSLTDAIKLNNVNPDIKIYSPLMREGYGILAKKNITIPSQIKKIGVIENDMSQFLASKLQERDSLSYSVIPLKNPSQLGEEFMHNRIDALVYFVPHIFSLSKNSQVIFWFDDIFPMHPSFCLVANSLLIEKFPQDFERLISIIEREVEELTGRPFQTIENITELFNISADMGRDGVHHSDFMIPLMESDKQFIKNLIGYLPGFKEENVNEEKLYYQQKTQQ